MWILRFSRLFSTVMLLSILSGCGGGNAESGTTTADPGSATTNGTGHSSPGIDVKTADSRPAGVVASIDNTNAATDLDGAKSITDDAQESTLPNDEATKMLREIQQLRISPVPTDLAEEIAALSLNFRAFAR